MLIGYKRACKKSSGGVIIIGLIEKDYFKTATLEADSGDYSAITLEASKCFKKYEFAEDEAEFKEEVKMENGSLSVTKNIIFKIPEMSGVSRGAVQEISDASFCGLIGLVITPNGDKFIVGYGEDVKAGRPLRISQASGTTGKKFSDARGEEITLACEHSEKSRLFTGETDALFTVPSV